MKKEVEFNWNKSCQGTVFRKSKTVGTCFEGLKHTLTSDAVLAHPDYESPLYVFTDASDYGIVAVSMQRDKKI